MGAHVRKIARAAARALLQSQGDGQSESRFAARFRAIEVGRTGTPEAGDLYFYVNLPASALLPGTSLGAPSQLSGADRDAVYAVRTQDAEGRTGPLVKLHDVTPETIIEGEPFFPYQFAGVSVD